MNSFTTINSFLLILIAAISFFAFSSYELFDKLKHYPFAEKREKSFYRWVSCAFVHGDTTHLLVNLLVLWSFGGLVENIYDEMFGPFAYVLVFFVILILSNIPSYIKYKDNSTYASVGASGVISGIVFISILYFPVDKIYLFGVLPIPAYLFGFLYLTYSWYAAKTQRDRIDHDAHLYGAVSGVLVGSLMDQSWISNWTSFLQ